LPDGPYELTVTAVDERGNRGSLTRRFWVDNRSRCAPPPPAAAPLPGPPSEGAAQSP